MNIIKRLYESLRWWGMYVIVDPSDDSITLSKRLYNHMDKSCGGKLKDVYSFSIPGVECVEYAFCCNPLENGYLNEEDHAPISPVQYNSEHKCIGFYAECPTANRIAYDYMLRLAPTKLSVRPMNICKTKCYRICRW